MLSPGKRLVLSHKELFQHFKFCCCLFKNNTIPKLVVPQVVCKQYRNFDIPKELKGLTRYLENAYKQDEFRYTCPKDSEILIAYQSVAKYLNK